MNTEDGSVLEARSSCSCAHKDQNRDPWVAAEVVEICVQERRHVAERCLLFRSPVEDQKSLESLAD